MRTNVGKIGLAGAGMVVGLAMGMAGASWAATYAGGRISLKYMELIPVTCYDDAAYKTVSTTLEPIVNGSGANTSVACRFKR